MAREIFKRVLLSEKGSKLQALNQFYVEVDRAATKPEIRQAIEAKFGVHVLKVRTANMKGAERMIRGTRLTKVEPTWKRATVTVKAGERIEQV